MSGFAADSHPELLPEGRDKQSMRSGMISGDTIAAISSSVGPAARMIVRVSGPESHRMVAALCPLVTDGGGATAIRTTLSLAGMTVPIWLYRFHAPHSYSGEDLAEFHVPGSPILVRMLLDELISRGARQAEPGEFTARAYFNGRIDLTEAEGVAATIAAHGEQELAAARQLLAGELSRRLRPLMEQLAQTLALVEVGIDFSEEDLTFISPAEIARRLNEIDAALDRLVGESARFERLVHEPQFVLAGRPNAGKSTLLNALAGSSRAVVSPVAGTTRDVLSVEIALDRGLVRLIDAAGLEESLPPLSDGSVHASIARQMHGRALAAFEAADFVLAIHDATDDRPPVSLLRPADVLILTKLDLLGAPPAKGDDTVAVSAVTGQNMDELRRRLADLAFGGSSSDASALALNSRHLQSIAEAQLALSRARQIAASAGAELVAMDLRESLDALGRILGQITPDDILGRVFAAFCIGK